MKLPMGASGSVTMRAKLCVLEGGDCQESSGESLVSPEQEVNWLGMVSVKLEDLRFRSGSTSRTLVRLQASWAAMAKRRSAAFRALRSVISAASWCEIEGSRSVAVLAISMSSVWLKCHSYIVHFVSVGPQKASTAAFSTCA